MLIIIQCFGMHCICHFQDEYVKSGCFWKTSLEQTLGGRGGFDSAVICLVKTCHQIHLLSGLYKTSTSTQPLYIHPEDENCSVCKKLGNFQHSVWLVLRCQNINFLSSHAVLVSDQGHCYSLERVLIATNFSYGSEHFKNFSCPGLKNIEKCCGTN